MRTFPWSAVWCGLLLALALTISIAMTLPTEVHP